MIMAVRKCNETEGERARRLWEQIEREGLFHVIQIVGGYEILVRVPWCRFARGIKTDEDLAKLRARHAAWQADRVAMSNRVESTPTAAMASSDTLPVVQVGKNESQFMLFG